MQELREFNLVYLATPYTRFRLGRNAAFMQSVNLACRLMVRGVNVFCPIAHTHPMTEAEMGGYLDPHQFDWARADKPFVEMCDAICVGMLENWYESTGVTNEIKAFAEQGKPRFFLEPRTLIVMPQELALDKALLDRKQHKIIDAEDGWDVT